LLLWFWCLSLKEGFPSFYGTPIAQSEAPLSYRLIAL
jgi:hypothetical protein